MKFNDAEFKKPEDFMRACAPGGVLARCTKDAFYSMLWTAGTKLVAPRDRPKLEHVVRCMRYLGFRSLDGPVTNDEAKDFPDHGQKAASITGRGKGATGRGGKGATGRGDVDEASVDTDDDVEDEMGEPSPIANFPGPWPPVTVSEIQRNRSEF